MAFRTNKMPVLQEKSASGSIATFNTALAMPLKSCTSLISGYQEGSGTPSPDNVRPLHAFSDASLSATGKNLIDVNINTSQYSGTYNFGKTLFGTFTLSAKKNDVVLSEAVWIVRIDYADGTYDYCGDEGYSNPFPCVIDATVKGIKSITWQSYGITSGSYDLMFELGSTASPYEPFGNSYTFTFGQDIYQGYIDWKRGVVVGNEVVFNAWNTLSFYYNSTQHFYRADISNMLANNDSTRSNIYNYVDKLWGSLVDYEFGVAGIQIRFHNETVSSSQELVNLLISQGVEIKYPLDNPITIPLGGVNLLTQQGQNNIFCDTGDIDLTYKDLDIAKRGNFREVFRLPS